MATQISTNATASGLGQRQTIGGRLSSKRQLWGVAIIGALALALAASLALGRALGSDSAASAPSIASAGDGPSFAVYREDHRAAATTFAPGFTETREDHRLPVTVAAPASQPSRPQPHQQNPARFDSRDYSSVAGAAGTAGYGTGVGVIEYLPGEEPSTGHGTPSGDSGPCLPLQPCPR